jgi:hypothetical protein
MVSYQIVYHEKPGIIFVPSLDFTVADLFAIVLLIFQLIRFGKLWATYPSGLSIAGCR